MRTNDTYSDFDDFDDYLDDMKEKSKRDRNWLALAAFLLGSRFVLDSLKPQGPRERPFLSKPRRVKDIPAPVFRDILKMDIKVGDYYHLFSEKELARFRQLSEELRHHGRLEDSRTVENTAMRWVKQKNKMLNEFGSAEAYRSGALDIYIHASQNGLVLKIPWSATGRNPCRRCWSLDGMLFRPEDFPGPQHFHCQCNCPMADPVWVF